MGAIRAPKFLLQQPQVFSGFNPAFPRPAFAFVASFGPYGVATQRVGTKASADSFRTTPLGISYKVARATSGGLDFGVIQPITSDAFTLIVLANPGAADGIGALVSQRYGSAPYYSFSLYTNMGRDGSSRSGGFSFLTVDSTGAITHSADTNSTSVVDGAPHVFGIAKAGATSDPILWRDGAIIASTGTGVGIGGNGTIISPLQKFRIGNPADYSADGSLCAACDVWAMLGFNGVLPDAMMQALTESLVAPYRIFQPPSRRLFVLGAAPSTTISATVGAGVGSGALATITSNLAIAAAIANATADGKAATIAANVTLSAAVGNVVADGQGAGISSNASVSAAVGNAAASGVSPAVAQNATVAATAGDAAANGRTANVSSNAALSAAVGNAAADGNQASVGANVAISCSVGGAAADGRLAAFASNVTVPAVTGNAAAAGASASVANGGTINGSIGDTVAGGKTAAVGLNVTIAAARGNGVASGQVASVLTGFTIPAQVAAAIAAGRIAGIFAGEKIDATTGNAAANGDPAAIILGGVVASALASYGRFTVASVGRDWIVDRRRQ